MRRKRISRACDQCNASRMKCDGQQPCARCIDFEMDCAYMRPRKKRARVSMKSAAITIPRQRKRPATVAIMDEAASSAHFQELSPNPGPRGDRADDDGSSTSDDPSMVPPQHLHNSSNFEYYQDERDRLDSFIESMGNMPSNTVDLSQGSALQGHNAHNSLDSRPPGLAPSSNDIQSSITIQSEALPATAELGISGLPGLYSPISDDALDPNLQGPNPRLQTQCSMGAQPELKFPVLLPLVPYMTHPLTVPLACNLLEGYFSTISGGYVPSSPFLLGHMLRRHSFLRSDTPRKCSPALLSSMLWVTAETTEEPFSSLSPTTRSRVCQTLLELTLTFLQPAVQVQNAGEARNGLPLTEHSHLRWHADSGASNATGSFDDVITFVHLATVVSAGRYKSASFRWWHSALQLAKELRLNHEASTSSVQFKDIPTQNDQWNGFSNKGVVFPSAPWHLTLGNSQTFHTAEEREERRRVWWTLYILDRHLALSFNSPFVIREVDCEGMLFPDLDVRWQTPEQWSNSQGAHKVFSVQELTQGTFAFFVPLMSILGQIIDFQHARGHPHLGKIYRGDDIQSRFIQEVSQQLETYRHSLNELTNKHSGTYGENEISEGSSDVRFSSTLPERLEEHHAQHESDFDLQKHTVAAYGNFFVHVMYILLHGRWDLISLFEDEDNSWISQPSFFQTLNHVIAAANALDNILEFDLDFSFNPYLLGIYLLQGSFIPFVVAARCQRTTSPEVLKACESFVRAHEICVVTLQTDYQGKYRKLMRSTIAMAKGRNSKLSEDEMKRQREVLALYRWAGNGMGLGV
ncbi:fungal-specific transcription factor domain-containing protein [Hyaloscypha sp. PMI_1271]|nr:fungal-specific transcription factor domain-containing protein [Hyaloscypha sp. PMI_1271]